MTCDQRASAPCRLRESLPLIRIDMRLTQDAAQRADWNFLLSRDDRDVCRCPGVANELDVAALLAALEKTRNFQPALNFAEWQWSKPPQPRPRWFGSWAAGWRAEARSKAPKPPLNYQELLLRFRPGLQHQFQDTARRTSRPHAKPMPRMDVSCRYSCTGERKKPS